MREHLVAPSLLVKRGRVVSVLPIEKMLTLEEFTGKRSVARTTMPETLWQNTASSHCLADHASVIVPCYVSQNLCIDF